MKSSWSKRLSQFGVVGFSDSDRWKWRSLLGDGPDFLEKDNATYCLGEVVTALDANSKEESGKESQTLS